MKFLSALKIFVHSTCPKVYEPLERYYTKKHDKNKGQRFQKNALEVFPQFVEAMNDAEVTFWPTFGTLLGCIRDKGLIPHDNDMDIAILGTTDFDRMNQSLTQRGFILSRMVTLFSKNGNQEKGYVATYMKDDVGIDLFATFLKDDGNIVMNEFLDSKVGDGFRLWTICRAITIPFEGLMDYNFLGCKVKVPTNYDAYLTALYGNYMVPDPNWKREMSPAASIMEGCIGVRFDK